MKEEKLLRAIGGIDDDLIDSAMAAKKKTHPAWVRWAAVAACLCLLVASPVGAAMGESLERIFKNGYTEHALTDRLRLKELTPEALAAFPGEKEETSYLTFDSMEDAEKYLGIEYPDNPVLEASVWDEMHWKTKDGEELDSHCIVMLSTGDEQEPYCVDAQLAYRMGGVRICVMYRLPTEKNPYDTGGGVLIETEGLDRIEYTDADGRVWDLYLEEFEDGGYGVDALSKVNGTLTWVQIYHVYGLPKDTLENLMFKIMEAYE